jgi:hypothetical protein
MAKDMGVAIEGCLAETSLLGQAIGAVENFRSAGWCG